MLIGLDEYMTPISFVLTRSEVNVIRVTFVRNM